jgi:4-hydroxy-4-methyl-2-oxoglutarate aldolase
MPANLSKEQLEVLRRQDSPTIANAIERFDIRPRVSGYAGYDLKCIFPEAGTMLGYAVTCTADSTTESRPNPFGLFPLWEAIERSPKPAVVLMQDIGDDRQRGCHLGEVMATTAKALGAIGCVTDAGFRDIREIRELGNFHLFCAGFVVSHGNPVICEVDVPIQISGMTVRPGDLLHGDINGLVIIPEGIADRVAEEADRIREMERQILDIVKSSDFSLEKLREFQKKFSH